VIDCPFCGATFRGAPSRRERRARCGSCSTVFVVPAATNVDFEEALDRELGEEQGRRKRPPATIARVAAWATLLCGLATIPITLLSHIVLVRTQGYLPSPLKNLEAYGLTELVTLLLLVGSLGLFLRQAWGWWSAFVGYIAGTVYYALLAIPVFLSLRWEHEAARSIAVDAGLCYGVPLMMFFLGALLLASARVRIAFGVKSQPYERRGTGRTPGRPGSRPRRRRR